MRSSILTYCGLVVTSVNWKFCSWKVWLLTRILLLRLASSSWEMTIFAKLVNCTAALILICIVFDVLTCLLEVMKQLELLQTHDFSQMKVCEHSLPVSLPISPLLLSCKIQIWREMHHWFEYSRALDSQCECAAQLSFSSTPRERRCGLASVLFISCHSCGSVTSVSTSCMYCTTPEQRGRPVYTVNAKAARGMINDKCWYWCNTRECSAHCYEHPCLAPQINEGQGTRDWETRRTGCQG